LNDVVRRVENIDFEYEGSQVRVRAVRDLPEIRAGDTVLGPLREGQELDIAYWVAVELVRRGHARFHEEDVMTLTLLNKVQWTETLQAGLRPSSLPEYFYPKLRRYLGDLQERAAEDAAAGLEHRQAEKIATDIVNCRVRKLVNLAASNSSAGSILRDLSREERAVYERLHALIMEWKANVV
jgi:hypothetical protein